MIKSLLGAVALAGAVCVAPNAAHAQMERVPDRPADEGDGPFETLVIKGATMIDGTGAPPEGPVDIIVQGNRITAIARGGGVDIQADRVIDANGMYVLPGFVDTHGHNGDPSKAPQPSYGFKLWLAHGVTSVRGVGFGFGQSDPSLDQKRRSTANTITAPRMFAYAVPGDVWPNGAVRTPQQGRAWVRWIAERGYDGIKFFNNEDPVENLAFFNNAISS